MEKLNSQRNIAQIYEIQYTSVIHKLVELIFAFLHFYSTCFRMEGLDPIKWSRILRNNLNIRKIQDLEQFGEKEYKTLKSNCENKKEKETLKKLIANPSFLLKAKTYVMNRIGKNEKNEETKPSEEEQMKSVLEVKEEIMSIDVHKHLLEVSKPQDHPNSVKVERESFSDAEVLKHASGGLALEGIYKSNNLVLFKFP